MTKNTNPMTAKREASIEHKPQNGSHPFTVRVTRLGKFCEARCFATREAAEAHAAKVTR